MVRIRDFNGGAVDELNGYIDALKQHGYTAEDFILKDSERTLECSYYEGPLCRLFLILTLSFLGNNSFELFPTIFYIRDSIFASQECNFLVAGKIKYNDIADLIPYQFIEEVEEILKK